MNKLSIIVKYFLSSLVILSAVIIVPASWANGGCTPYTASFHLEGTSPFGPLNGGGIYIIGDLPPMPAQLGAVLKGSASFDPTAPVSEFTFSSMALFQPGADGVLSILTGVDNAVGVPTGPGTFEGTTKSRITGGTGMFEGVTGKALSTSSTTVDLTTGFTTTDINVEGKICGLGGDDDEDSDSDDGEDSDS